MSPGGSDASQVVLKESAVVRVGRARVGCGNLWERDYQLADGTKTQGMTARVSLDGAVHFVGAGSELAIDGVVYRVIGIDKQSGTLGRVRLEPTS